jgi:hypothetical protein
MPRRYGFRRNGAPRTDEPGEQVCASWRGARRQFSDCCNTAQEGRRARYEFADPQLTHALSDLVGLVLTANRCSIEE